LYINIAGSVTTVSACPDMEMLMSQVALAAFLAELGEAVEEAELEGMTQLLLAMLCLSAMEENASGQ
jgi:hypothetical protein